MKETLYDNLVNTAVDSVNKILDPIEKVKAITSLLPFVSKDTVIESNRDKVEAIAKQVEKQVAENIIKMDEAEKRQPKAEPVAATSESYNSDDEEIIVKDKESEAEIQKRYSQVIKRYGHMTLGEFCGHHLNYLSREFGGTANFKAVVAQFIERNYPGANLDPEQLLMTYMAQCEPDNPAIMENSANIHVKAYLEKFIPVIVPLYKLFSSFDKDEISKVMVAMSGGKLQGIQDVNIDNVTAIEMALEDSHKAN